MALVNGHYLKIEGVEEVMSFKQVVDYTQYYEIGGTISPKSINTLDQLFARIMVVGESHEELLETLSIIRNLLNQK